MALKVGIAGYGVVAKKRHECILANPNLQLIAVCDKTFKQDGQFDNGVLFFKTYKDLLQQELDILFVCLTNDIVSEVCMAALKKGLHVFCEKPPGRNLTDVEIVLEQARQYPHLKLMYGFNHRHYYSALH